MPYPIQVTFHGLPHTSEDEEALRGYLAELGRYTTEIHGVQAVVDVDEKHQKTGRNYQVRIQVDLPGKKLRAGDHGDGHPGLEVAARHTCKALKRQLEDYTSQRQDYRAQAAE